MSEIFDLEIVRPDQILLKSEATEAIVPAYEGLITILKNHIPLVTFLRPGIIKVMIKGSYEEFYLEEGTVEFSKNKLLILSSNVKNKKDLSKEEINMMLDNVKKEISVNNLKDKEKYILSHKLEILKEISQ